MDVDTDGTVVILTALNLEYDAVRAHLTDIQRIDHPAGTLFEMGRLSGGRGRVVLSVAGEGNTGAAVLTERAITMFQPKALMFVGVAGALKAGVELGDVVVATRVYLYHGGKEDDDGFSFRPRGWEIPHHLDQIARHVVRVATWQTLLPDNAQPAPTVHFKPIAAGEVVLNARATPLAQQLRRNYGDAVAIEMESAGVSQAGHFNRSLPVVTIRGISDKADGAKPLADDEGWQPIAAANAAAFALTLAREICTATVDPADASPAEPPGRVSPGVRRYAAEPAPRSTARMPVAGVRRRKVLAAVPGLATLLAIGVGGFDWAGRSPAGFIPRGQSSQSSVRDPLDQTLEGHTGEIWELAYSPDGTQLASASSDGSVRIWHALTGTLVHTLERCHDGAAINWVAYARDGSRLATAGTDGAVRIWTTDTFELLDQLRALATSMESLAFSSTGAELAVCGRDGFVGIWPVEADKQIQPMTGHRDDVEAVVYSPDGSRMATASRDTTALVWDAKTGEIIHTLSHAAKVFSVAYSRNGLLLATASEDGIIRLWRADTGRYITGLHGHEGSAESVAFSPNGLRLATAGSDGTVRLWNTETGTPIDVKKGHDGPVWSVAYSPDRSNFASAGKDKKIRLWRG